MGGNYQVELPQQQSDATYALYSNSYIYLISLVCLHPVRSISCCCYQSFTVSTAPGICLCVFIYLCVYFKLFNSSCEVHTTKNARFGLTTVSAIWRFRPSNVLGVERKIFHRQFYGFTLHQSCVQVSWRSVKGRLRRCVEKKCCRKTYAVPWWAANYEKVCLCDAFI